MLHILFYVSQIVLLIILLSLIFLFLLWAIGNFKNKVPFVTASSAVLRDIDKAMEVKDDSVVYDLGCGDGRVLFYLSNLNKKAKYIGIENNRFAIILARLGLIMNNKKNVGKVEIINNDFFNQDISDATHIFTYLYPNIMDDLLPKFDKELKTGTKLVSLSFKFTSKNPIAEIDLKRSKYKLGRKLYVYQF